MTRDKLGWAQVGERFKEGSRLSDWQHFDAGELQWQYDTHELHEVVKECAT